MAKKIGILGGGQLGKMLLQASIPFEDQLYFLDHEHAPLHYIHKDFIIGDITSESDVLQFAKDLDVLSIEIENVSLEALEHIDRQPNQVVIPQPDSLRIIKDKGLQKEFYQKHALPTSKFELFPDLSSLLSQIQAGTIKFPFVQKTRQGGYDGRGVHVVHSIKDLDEAFDAPCLVEEKIDIDKELAIIIVRSPKGEIKTYDPVEMVFHPTANLVEFVAAPANISESIKRNIETIAQQLVEKLDYYGLLAIEFFLSKDGEILINECAPRTHNSGHWTIEATFCSQFEQHARVLMNLPLGHTQMIHPHAIMFNLLGEAGYHGDVKYENLEAAYDHPLAKVHLYGKTQTKPFRKMGHVTLVGDDRNVLLKQAQELKSKIKVLSYE